MKIRGFDRVILGAVPPFAYGAVRLLRRTMRFEYRNFDYLKERHARGENLIYAFWHGRLLMMSYGYFGSCLTLLVSSHKDGELVKRFNDLFGFHAARGSTTRGSVRGVKEILRAVSDGSDIGITPDGPKGPPRRAQSGVVEIARMTGLPIVPVTFSAGKKKIFPAGTPSFFPCPSAGASL